MNAELCVALDGSDRDWILRLAEELAPVAHWLKVGLEAFTAFGPNFVREISSFGPRVFLDLKFHDIPNTVAGAVRNTGGLGVGLLNVHASGGVPMMKAAAAALAQTGGETRLIAVTVLTSLDREELLRLGLKEPGMELVSRWAYLAKESGLDGVVCSPLEIRAVRKTCGEDFLIVTPGVRPVWATRDDQRRTMTPAEAQDEGAHILVIGRPITRAAQPREAAQRIIDELR